MPVPEQLAEIAIFRTRHPDPRETIFQHQLQQKLSGYGVRTLPDAYEQLKRAFRLRHPR